MKAFSFSLALWFGFLVGSEVIDVVSSFVVSPGNSLAPVQPARHGGVLGGKTHASGRSTTTEAGPLFSSTSTRPLYDGTNYTFPDTRSPAGVAELLEVSFVHACMQLASGYVDVLKMFIATSIGAYEAGFSIDCILEELEGNQNLPNTANRPLMEEEKTLRRDWLCVVYLALAAMDHTPTMPSPLAADVSKKSIPRDIEERYGAYTTAIGDAYKNGSLGSLSVEGLVKDAGSTKDLSPIDKAVLMQSLKVASLTPTVVEEAREASGNNSKPPTPPIEGAF